MNNIPSTIDDTLDTICAISTPPGTGGIAIIRLSGPDSINIAQKIWQGQPIKQFKTHTVHLGQILDPDGNQLDQAVLTIFKAPKSYTGQDTIEFSVHGSRYIQQQLINSLINAGARLANPGEFTRRAFTLGRIDLVRAEAVADIITANSRSAHRLAISQLRGDFSNIIKQLHDQLLHLSALLELELDFSDQDVQFADRTTIRQLATDIHSRVNRLHQSFATGQAIKEGIPVAIVGPTNAGKSSLLNTLTGDDTAIVSDIHGTTRDTIQETITIGDYQFRLIDTAGLRHTNDTIEQIGIQRTHRAINQASIIIALHDNTTPFDTATLTSTIPSTTDTPIHYILALNKTDLPTTNNNQEDAHKFINNLPPNIIPTLLTISATTHIGIEQLTLTLTHIATTLTDRGEQDTLVTNLRHAQALAQASTSAQEVIQAIDADLPADLISQPLRATIHHLAAITGDIPSPQILSTIFSRFCIGK